MNNINLKISNKFLQLFANHLILLITLEVLYKIPNQNYFYWLKYTHEHILNIFFEYLYYH